jgi:hypothetical protein
LLKTKYIYDWLMMQAHNTGKSGRGKVLGKMRKGTVPQLSCSSPQAQHRPAC